MKYNLSLSQKGLLVVAITLVLEMIFVSVLIKLLHDADQELAREQHAQAVIYHLNRQANLMQRLTIEFIRFVVTQKPDATPQQMAYSRQIAVEFQVLRDLLANDPKERAAVENIRTTLTYGQSLMDACRRAWFDDNRPLHLRLAAQMHTVSDRCTFLSDQILEDFKRLEQTTHERREKIKETLQWWLAFVLVFNIPLGLILAFLFTRGITRRLETIADNSMRLSMGKALHPLLGGKDELAKVDATFHHMADALEAARRKERAVFENTSDVICTIDEHEKFTSVSAAARANWGYEPEDLIGSRFISLISADDREKTIACIERIIKEGAVLPIENRVVKKDGDCRHVLWSAHWSPKEKSLFCVAHDMTARREIEIMKQEFVSMVSHDLRTPLSAIRGTLMLIEESVIDTNSDNGKKRVQAAQQSAERLIDLVNDLLDIEKLEGGNLQLDLQCIDLNYIIKSSIDSVRVYADSEQVLLKDTETSLQVIADRDRCIQVLINLLSNAIKFSPQGGVVEVAVSEHSNFAEVRVIDSGCGIPAQFKETIFERFKQVKVSDGKRGKGTGLGLAICKAIIESHGGSIGVDSTEGEGSRFWFRIPLA